MNLFSRLLLLLALLLNFLFVSGQNAYQKGWQSLNNADVDNAIKHFEQARKSTALKEKSLLCLTLLYSQNNREEDASACFEEYFNLSKDPYPALYALWFEEGVLGNSGIKEPHQLERLQKIYKDNRNTGKLDGGTLYRLGVDRIMAFDKPEARKYYDKLKSIDEWAMLGPFDNVMNSGFDKDFGVVSNPGHNARFISKYGAEVSWFNPPFEIYDSYFFKDMYFLSSNSLIYTQTFIKSDSVQDVFLKFGYSGSMKVWLNDSLIYAEPENRETEMDYYRFKCTLNKGYNRVLVQLGDYNENYPSFVMRFTDMEHNPVKFPQSKSYQPYQKGLKSAEKIPFFAVEALEKKIKDDPDPIYKFLMVKAYLRSKEIYEAEEILEAIYKTEPKNFFVLRDFNLLYEKSGDNTNQNKYYQLFKETYPDDMNIMINNIEEYRNEGNKNKYKNAVASYLAKYSNPYNKLYYEMIIADMDNDLEKTLLLIDSLYIKFPDDYTSVSTRYEIEKNYYMKPESANRILEKYLESYYNYNFVNELVSNYVNEGFIEKAIDLLKKNIEIVNSSLDSYQYLINLLSRQSKYAEAIEICKTIQEIRPSDYQNYADLAVLNLYLNDKKSAVAYYEQALNYFPFSFEIYETIRDLNGFSPALELVPDVDPIKTIRNYEKEFKAPVKKSYDIVLNTKALIVNKYKATATVQRLLLKINDEKAIKQWQNVNINSGSNYESFINEARTIKKTNEKIDAERNNGQVVFTNLEVGDYIYVHFTEKQINGGKSSLFISDRFALNSMFPAYNIEYSLYAENGVVIKDTLLNGKFKPVVKKKEGYNIYHWTKKNADLVKDESYSVPFSDIAEKIHISLDYTWKDIVQWYGDLSTYQAAPDYTIRKITNDLFNGRSCTDEEKARIIYDYVCKNIQYSSIDFRQGQYVPQKASKVYHSRLGDCKDMSTLYVSLARAAGLKANLVLINTSDNGENDVILPSLNFNHCIVKVYLDNENKYLELTDPDLPFGHLYHYHKGAAILEIPINGIAEDAKLDKLNFNSRSNNEIIRSSTLGIGSDFKMKIGQYVLKTGTRAASACKNYYYADDADRRDILKKSIAPRFKSSILIDHLNYEKLQPLNDSAIYTFNLTIDNEVLKLGTMRSFKIPFTDLLVSSDIFEEDKRFSAFNFVYYENTDKYVETMEITLDGEFTFIELPEDIHLIYNGNTYDLKFEQLSERKLKVNRTYNVNRNNVHPEEFLAFKDFLWQVKEAEHTNLIFK